MKRFWNINEECEWYNNASDEERAEYDALYHSDFIEDSYDDDDDDYRSDDSFMYEDSSYSMPVGFFNSNPFFTKW